MRRFPWLPVIVAAGVGVLMLGALLGSGTWAEVFMTKPDQLACMTVQTPTGKVTSCSTVEGCWKKSPMRTGRHPHVTR